VLFLAPSQINQSIIQIDHPRLGLPVNAMQWLQQCSCAEVLMGVRDGADD